jgi:hypothetical protein
MPVVVPTQPIANQTLQVQLGGQACTLNIYQQAYGLFMDVIVGATPIIQGVICMNAKLIVRSTYLGFSGDLEFVDTQPSALNGPSDPVYTGLGSRYQLLYLSATEIAALNLPVGVE